MCKSYIIVKPDGMNMFKDLIAELEKQSIKIDSIYKLTNFDRLAIPLYLDVTAIHRGNAPIIIGINKEWQHLGSTFAFLLMLSSASNCETEPEFIDRVCKLKKDFRKKHLPNGYKLVTANITKKDYEFYNIPYSETLSYKRLVTEGNKSFYNLQLNGIHCPDSELALKREMEVFCDLNVLNHSVTLGEAIKISENIYFILEKKKIQRN